MIEQTKPAAPSAVTLRRRNTTPEVFAPISVGRNIARHTHHRLTMKSNPYVGWFRHSPPTSRLSKNNWRQQRPKPKMQWYTVPSSLSICKDSPHIGWFRHAPPSRLDALKSSATTEEEELLMELVEELKKNPSLLDVRHVLSDNKQWVVSGHLPGGGKEYLEGTRNHQVNSSRFVQDLQESSREGTLSTVNALSRLASWFLFPVAHDAESCGYHRHDFPRKRKSRRREDGLLRHLSPYLPTFLEEPPRRQEKYARYVTTTAEDNDNAQCEDDESDGSDCDSVASSLASSPPVPQNLIVSSDLNLSVSSLAEAYYAHQATTKNIMVTSRNAPPPNGTESGFDESPLNPHRLDYVITQMDIARMTRNASRHLDVQSILSLPVITYQKGVAIKSPKQQTEGWSWTMVEEISVPHFGEEIIPGEDDTPKAPEGEFCVICLERFVNGDRLRVLPCDHSFHVGCIDRWLSGSQSFEECYTCGCPTCKKHPIERTRFLCDTIPENPRRDVYRSEPLDGSVPSWAFAQIGSALVAQEHQA